MKKKLFPLAAVLLLSSSLMFQSCIGSFSLTNKVLTWNQQVSNKFVNELVFFAFWILPVYEVTAAADLLVINSIEFWSGTSPLEARNNVIDTEQGKYLIASDENGYKITAPNGDILNFLYSHESDSWSFAKNGNDKIEFLKFEDPSHVKVLGAEGEFVDVELTETGVGNFMAGSLMPLFAKN